MIASKITDLIGNTPMLKLKMKNNDWNVFLKLEKFNPGGSMKDRMALNMIEEAEKSGQLKPGGTIIESSSGNTAIGLAIASAIKGYHFIAVVDHHASKEKPRFRRADPRQNRSSDRQSGFSAGNHEGAAPCLQ